MSMSSASEPVPRGTSVAALVQGIGRLNHVAIAVPDLEAATTLYRDVLGAEHHGRPLAAPELHQFDKVVECPEVAELIEKHPILGIRASRPT